MDLKRSSNKRIDLDLVVEQSDSCSEDLSKASVSQSMSYVYNFVSCDMFYKLKTKYCLEFKNQSEESFKGHAVALNRKLTHRMVTFRDKKAAPAKLAPQIKRKPKQVMNDETLKPVHTFDNFKRRSKTYSTNLLSSKMRQKKEEAPVIPSLEGKFLIDVRNKALLESISNTKYNPIKEKLEKEGEVSVPKLMSFIRNYEAPVISSRYFECLFINYYLVN